MARGTGCKPRTAGAAPWDTSKWLGCQTQTSEESTNSTLQTAAKGQGSVQIPGGGAEANTCSPRLAGCTLDTQVKRRSQRPGQGGRWSEHGRAWLTGASVCTGVCPPFKRPWHARHWLLQNIHFCQPKESDEDFHFYRKRSETENSFSVCFAVSVIGAACAPRSKSGPIKLPGNYSRSSNKVVLCNVVSF